MAEAEAEAGATHVVGPSQLSSAQLEQVRLAVLAYTAAHGINMLSDGSGVQLVHAPVTLLPTPLPQSAYDQVVALTPLWNELVDRVSRDEHFLLEHLEGSARADPWLARLLDILKQLAAEGRSLTQPLRLGIYRSDYMIHVEEEAASAAEAGVGTPAPAAAASAAAPVASPRLIYTAQQVELNTIAASFAGLSTRVAAMHRYVMGRELHMHADEVAQRLPQNDAIQRIAEGINAAFQLYKQQRPSPNLCVLMVVQPGESNAVDQRILEYTLWNNHAVPLIRRTLHDIATHSTFDEAGQLLMDHAAHTVAIVYFRAGYTPRDYPSDAEYRAIYLVERSLAIKCPSLATHLAGTKKVQQVLAQAGQLERFVSRDESAQLRACFAGLYALDQDDATTRALLNDVAAHPASYVLKPQREGGGNNLWGGEMVSALQRMSVSERAAFILMRKIEPRPTRAALFRRGELTVADAISELGIYSVHVGDGTRTHHSAFCGHLLRTKAVGVDEGGVAAGFSCLSSVCFQ